MENKLHKEACSRMDTRSFHCVCSNGQGYLMENYIPIWGLILANKSYKSSRNMMTTKFLKVSS